MPATPIAAAAPPMIHPLPILYSTPPSLMGNKANNAVDMHPI